MKFSKQLESQLEEGAEMRKAQVVKNNAKIGLVSVCVINHEYCRHVFVIRTFLEILKMEGWLHPEPLISRALPWINVYQKIS